MKKIVISLGGSLLFGNDGKFDIGAAKKLSIALIEAKKYASQLIVIVGGGALARKYANAARQEFGSEFYADRRAILATKENAKKMIELLGNYAYEKVMDNFDMADLALKEGKIAVGGGMLEGLTTDAVSVLYAEKIKTDFIINLGDTDGIYDADPKKDPHAKLIPKMSHTDLTKLANESDQRRAGTHFVFDLVASKLAARSNIELRFLNGKKPQILLSALNGKTTLGTVVKD